jgi:hemoglobin
MVHSIQTTDLQSSRFGAYPSCQTVSFLGSSHRASAGGIMAGKGLGKGVNMQSQGGPTLYDRLGGVYNIATVVDDLIDRVMSDSRLNANPRVDEAHHRVSPAGFKYHVTEMVCEAAGGPQTYSGRSMGDSHRHLMITDDEWLAFMDDLQKALDRFDVPQPEQEEIKAIVESTKESIVVEPLHEGPGRPENHSSRA